MRWGASGQQVLFESGANGCAAVGYTELAEQEVLAKLEVRGDMAPRVGEWGMGDDARVIIQDDFHPNLIDTAMRIVAADITPPDANTDETVELTMAPVLDDLA